MTGDLHIMPNLGKPHDASPYCWCQPGIDPATLDANKYRYRTWIHRVQQ